MWPGASGLRRHFDTVREPLRCASSNIGMVGLTLGCEENNQGAPGESLAKEQEQKMVSMEADGHAYDRILEISVCRED